jgi:ABC-type Zn uptake system ZnuABC Zn-binding protein ZnuA
MPADRWDDLTGAALVMGPPVPLPVWTAHYVDIPEKPAIRKGKLRVFVTMPALCCFLRNVAGEGLVDVEMQAPVRSSVFHNTTWSTGPDEIGMFHSDLVIWNGLGIDSWIEPEQRRMSPARRIEEAGGGVFIESVPSRVAGSVWEHRSGAPLMMVEDVEVTGSGGFRAVSPMTSGTTVEIRARDTSFVMASEGIAAKEHMVPWEFFTLGMHQEAPPGGRAPEGRNPYVWLDPVLAIREVENIRDGLIRMDPIHRHLYIGNTNAYLRRLRALDAEARRRVAGLSRKRLLGIGDEFAYFLSRYGIEQTGVYYPGIGGELFDRDAVGYFRQLMTERPSDGMILPRDGLADSTRRAFADLELPMAELDPMDTGDGGPDYYERVTRANLDALSVALK